jgi:hypothetical protein
MPTILVLGDAASTTAVALAATRPGRAELVEADDRGGSLAAWWGIDHSTTSAPVLGIDLGLGLLPHHPAEAAHLLGLAELSGVEEGVLRVVDGGCPVHHPERHRWAGIADVALVVVRQGFGPPRMVARRVERGAHLVARLAAVVPVVTVAVIGRSPFRPADVGAHLLGSADGSGTVVVIPEDPRGAAMVADPAGVTHRRWLRSDLAKALGSFEVPA